jgi:epoxide hydrolase
MLLAVASFPLLSQGRLYAQASSTPRPFRIDIPQAKIDRILARVRDAEWPDRLDAPDLRYGVSWDYMKALAKYWIEQYDWRKAEASLNRYPQFLARIGDYDIHFYHVKGRGPKPMPLILTHGWPGSVFEFLNAIGPLSDPASFGGSPDDAFDVVVPSLPGFGFSSKPRGRPIGAPTVAALWNRLMTEVLGYPKYGAQGGDIGSRVTVQLALNHKDSLFGALACISMDWRKDDHRLRTLNRPRKSGLGDARSQHISPERERLLQHTNQQDPNHWICAQ